MISLAKLTGNEKYSGLLVKENKDGSLTYYMKYRDYHNRVVKKAIRNIPNITHNKALKEFNRVKQEIYEIKNNLSITKEKKINLITLNEMADFYFENHFFKKVHQERKRYNFHIRDEEFASKPLILVTSKELHDFKDKMFKKHPVKWIYGERISYDETKTLQPATVNHILVLCNTIIKYAIQNERYKDDNPFNYMKRVKFDNVSLKQMSEEEIEEYLDALKNAQYSFVRLDYKHSLELGYLFGLLALTTGARKKTILQIKVKDINFNDNTISLYNYKTDTPYIGHIVSDEVENTLKEHCKNKELEDYIFYNYKTQKVYDGYPIIVKRKLDAVINHSREQKDRLAVRDFRNVFATRLINKGMNLSHIQNLLNHKTPDMTSRYAQMLDKTGGEELKQMFSNIKL